MCVQTSPLETGTGVPYGMVGATVSLEPHTPSRNTIIALLNPLLLHSPHQLLGAVLVVWARSLGSADAAVAQRHVLMDIVNSIVSTTPDAVSGTHWFGCAVTLGWCSC